MDSAIILVGVRGGFAGPLVVVSDADVVLAEASDTGLDTPRLDAVKKLAKALLAKRPTPG